MCWNISQNKMPPNTAPCVLNQRWGYDSNRLLWVCLVLAAVMHLIFVLTIKITRVPQAPAANVELTVLLSKPSVNQFVASPEDRHQPEHSVSSAVEPVKQASPSLNHVDADARLSILGNHAQTEAFSASNQPNDEKTEQEHASIQTKTEKPTIKLQQLLDQANQMARDEGRQMEKASPSKGGDGGVQAVLSAAIGKAFDSGRSHAQPKVTQYADGMVEVITAYGTKYCFAPSKDFAQTGPLAPQGIPMTCP